MKQAKNKINFSKDEKLLKNHGGGGDEDCKLQNLASIVSALESCC